jgi:hypothetical protein
VQHNVHPLQRTTAPVTADLFLARLAAVLEMFPRCASCGRRIAGDATLTGDGRRAVCSPRCPRAAA